MLRIALRMLFGDRAKAAGLLFGVAFTAFLVTFAASFFCGFMTRGFALVSENPEADVWVMDPAVESVEATIELPGSALGRVRSVAGVEAALPLAVGSLDVRFADGRFQGVQVIGVDDATLAGLPPLEGGVPPSALRVRDAVVVDDGGTEGKLETPLRGADRWPHDGPHLGVPTRPLAAGDDLLAGDRRVVVVGRAHALPRFPPRPLLYTTYSNALRILPPTRNRTTFVLVKAAAGTAPAELARRIEERTGLRARTAADLEADTVRWALVNSEDVGDVGAMLSFAITVGLGLTAVLLYMFTLDSLRQYAVLSAMGATPRRLLGMVFAQAGSCAFLGTGVGLGAAAIAGRVAAAYGFPFRLMWFTPLFGATMVAIVCVLAALLSSRPLLALEPMASFGER